ncbi:hypothetical protein EV191_1011132 [Tamaricihabitans halophyticus]|uniref:Acyltransferase-like protein n=1 Tax=Tamaricihabitans halophyticus TaxID=1262583 RepID=A0A4R2R5T7_9PSEU|nr:hypothetical protein [Tamaricihabitans halophyticus]TCP57179.1 hypothetical protein EV191_1011132 [Tamaricihabitans halophyticus]
MAPPATETVPRLRPVAQEPAVTLLRAAAAVLLCYAYLIGLWITEHDRYLGLVDVLRRWVNQPFGLGEDFGGFASMLLLAVSGYLAAHSTGARLARLLAPVPIAALLAAGLLALGAPVWTQPDAGASPVAELVGAGLLVGPLIPELTALLPLGSLVLLACAGTLAAAATNWLPRRLRWLSPLLQLAIAAALVVAGAAVDALSAVALLASWYPMVIVGQVIYLNRGRALPAWLAVLYAGGCWALIAVAEPLLPPLTGWWYPVAAAFAGLLVAVTVLMQGRTVASFAANPAIRWASTRVWQLALLIGPVGWPLLNGLDAAGLPLPLNIALATAGLVIAAELLYWLLYFAWLTVGRRWEPA